MNDAVLLRLARLYGADPRHCLAGGGNASLKSGARMWVKASGVAMATIESDGFVEMDLPSLSELVATSLGEDPHVREARFKEAIHAARTHPELGQRPSVECLVHAVVPGRYVMHTHATIANALTCCVRSRELCRDLFEDAVVYVPYVDPGFELARRIHLALAGRSAPGIVLLENHGLIAFADDEASVRAQVDAVLGLLEARLPRPSPELPPDSPIAARTWPILRWAMADQRPPYLWGARTSAHLDPDLGPMTPDQIVHCRSWPLFLEPDAAWSDAQMDAYVRERLTQYQSGNGISPRVALLPDGSVAGIDPDPKMARTAADMALDAAWVAEGARALGGPRALSLEKRAFIEAWEVESYRQSVHATQVEGRLVGRVAMVTGAAKGLGHGLARELAREGALVLAADLEPILSHELGPSERVRTTYVDVADPGLSEAAARFAGAACGGVDLLVSNAGILRAGSVFEQSPEDFEAVNRVNFHGFFHMVRAVGPIMRAQRVAAPEAWFDVVQINSKSGLEGSARNFAYAGSKFGSIGLVQSFALELVAQGIKVNAICPGNFFEGPLWSDPENGLFAQYLRTGKVPLACTLDDVRRAYEAKVPMGRGVTVADVFTALLYLVEQRYETGQALPVTGGQVLR